VKYIVHPSEAAAERFIQDHHIGTPRKTILIIVGRCKIEYAGRAKSYLDWGDRVTIIKKDGTILVHKHTQRNPINWQPEGTVITLERSKNCVTLKTVNRKKRERMSVTFDKIDMIMATELQDHAQLEIVGMEFDLTSKIEENPELIEPGFRVTRREKQTKSGVIDLRGVDKDNIPAIIEVKRGKATISAVHQLRMYINDIKKLNPKAPLRGILVASYIPAMVKNLLDDYDLEHREIRIQHKLEQKKQQKLDGFTTQTGDTAG
jgi:RecB family endonuclease NucS